MFDVWKDSNGKRTFILPVTGYTVTLFHDKRQVHLWLFDGNTSSEEGTVIDMTGGRMIGSNLTMGEALSLINSDYLA